MKKSSFFVMLFVLASCVSTNKNKANERYPAQYPPLSSNIKLLKFEDVIRVIKDKEAKTVEDLLAALYIEYPDYLKLHTLMYGSLSLHESSFQEPRAIVYGPFGDFILTFNGGPHMRAGHAVEVMEFQESTGDFHFREIAFKSQSKDSNPLSKEEIEFENSNFYYSKPNPQKCIACHGDKPRPIWETYFLWPGAYGSNDDLLTNFFHKAETGSGNFTGIIASGGKPGDSQGRWIKLKNGIRDREAQEFQKFIQNKFEHPRYKFLPHRAIDKAFVRLNAGEPPESIDISDDIAEEVRKGVALMHMRPNLALNELLYSMTSKSLVLRSQQNPRTLSLPYKLLWLRYCHSEAGQAMPEYQDGFYHEKTDPLEKFSRILLEGETQQIRRVSGSWKKFYRQFLIEEFEMNIEKLQRHEETFGPLSLEVTSDFLTTEWKMRSKEYYENLRGRKLNRLETISSYDESDDLFLEAAAAYIAKGMGLELNPFGTNLQRVASFREGGLMRRDFLNLDIKGLNLESSMYTDQKTETCKKIQDKAIASVQN